jgi:RimJ/RimL family protein N-acetyltransferase
VDVKAPVEFHTDRLTLAPPGAADAAAIFASYASDPDVTRYLGWPRHRSIGDSEWFVRLSAEQWRRWPAGPYLIRLRSDGRLIGSTGLAFDAPTQAITGYVLAKEAWGRGYATEALSAMVDIARQVGVVRLYALCHPDHRVSSRVLEKCGFTRDREWSRPIEFPNLAPGRSEDVWCYARTP